MFKRFSSLRSFVVFGLHAFDRMRLRLLLFISLISLTPATAIAAQRSPNTMNPSTSQAIQTLTSRRDTLHTQSNGLEGKQDYWHRLAFIAGLIAGAAALFIGFAQHIESKRAYSLRAINKERDDANGQIFAMQLEQEKTARVELLKSLSYRGLNVGQMREVRKASIAFKDVPLDIIFCPTDTEINLFSGSLFEAFTAWKPGSYGVFRPTSPGLSIDYNPKDLRAAEAATHFFEALNKYGLRVNGPSPVLPQVPKELLDISARPTANLRLVVGYRDPVRLPMDIIAKP